MSLTERMQARRHGLVAPADRPDPLAAIRERVRGAVIDELGPQIGGAVDDGELAAMVGSAAGEALARDEIPLTHAERQRVAADVADDILGHGPLEPYLRDPSVSEIMVCGHAEVYIERDGRIYDTGARFASEAHLRRVIDKIVARVGRRIDESSPMADARLPDGSRVNAVVAPVALDGSLLTIRKFGTRPLDAGDLVAAGTVSDRVMRLLRACVAARLNIVISGGTGSGKTTTLNVLSGFAGAGERIVTIEDAAELQLRRRHVLRMEARPPNLEGRGEITVRDLVRNALRMRPDRIIVGEVRDGAALDMLQAMNTGHDGSITTVHANAAPDALSRLETMTLMAGMQLPQRAVREQIASAINLIIHQARMAGGERRITGMSQVTGIAGGEIVLREVLAWDHRHGRLAATGREGELVRILAARGEHTAWLGEDQP